jgi:hypothetical protein
VRRWGAAALALGVLLSACTDDVGSGDEPDEAAATTTTTTTPSAATVRLGQVLIPPERLAPLGFEPVVVSRGFVAQRATRIKLCGVDLRAELRIVGGRQSRFSNGEVEVSHTVTSGGDTNAFLDRFQEVVDECDGPWPQPPLSTGGGVVQREITGPYPVPDVGIEGSGVIVRSRNQAGSSDTIVIVLVQGAVVSSLSVSGPLGSDFSIVDPAVQAAADQLVSAQSVAAP